MRTCPQCDREYDDNEGYCIHCGVELDGGETGLDGEPDPFADDAKGSHQRAVTREPSIWQRLKTPNKSVAGMVMALVVVVVVVAVLSFRESGKFYVEISFDEGFHGLKVGDNVFVMGRAAGNVTKLDTIQQGEYVVTITVDEDAQQVLRDDTWFYVDFENWAMAKKRINTIPSLGKQTPLIERGQAVEGEDSESAVAFEIARRKLMGLWNDAW